MMELGPENPDKDGLLGPNSIMVLDKEPLGNLFTPTSPYCEPKAANRNLELNKPQPNSHPLSLIGCKLNCSTLGLL